MNDVIFLIFPKIYRDFVYFLPWFSNSPTHYPYLEPSN